MEDVYFSLNARPLFIGIAVLFTIPVFGMQEESAEVVPHEEQLVSVSNSTCRAEPGVFPGDVLGVLLLFCCMG